MYSYSIKRDRLFCPSCSCSSYLKIADVRCEWVLAQSPLLVQELAGFAVGGREKQAVVEALSQLLQRKEEKKKRVFKRMA